MKIWGVLAVSGFLMCWTDPIACDSFSDVHSDPIASLNTTLKKFVGPRNHMTSSDAKEKARDLIKKSFQDFGLHVWSENVVLNKTVGENIVGLLRAKKTNTADDKIVIVGAHYDTVPKTTGVDDNGSGVTALLETAKQIGKAHCKFNNTVMFVAFDFEERYDECNDIRCGSKQFVNNLTVHLQGTKGTVNGAFVLETILNHNTSKGSQYLPPGLELTMKDVVDEVKNDSYRGNFIGVIGRRQPDKELLTLFTKYYKSDSDYRAQLMQLPIPAGVPLPEQLAEFYRSDHYSFWANKVSYSAVSLTDTADFRGYMERCYHKTCDNLRPVKDADLEFLRRTINALIQSVLDLSKARSCDTSVSAASMSGTLNLALLLAGFISSAIIAAN